MPTERLTMVSMCVVVKVVRMVVVTSSSAIVEIGVGGTELGGDMGTMVFWYWFWRAREGRG